MGIVYKIAFQRASVGILILKKLKGRVRTSFCWPRESKPHPLAHRTVSKTRQSDRKIYLEKNLVGPLTQMSCLKRPSENALQREMQRVHLPVGPGKGAYTQWRLLFYNFFSLNPSTNVMIETVMILSVLPRQ